MGRQGQEVEGLGRPPSRCRGCLEAMARVPEAQGPPRPSQAQIQGALDFGGPGLVNGVGGGAGAVPGGTEHRADIP